EEHRFAVVIHHVVGHADIGLRIDDGGFKGAGGFEGGGAVTAAVVDESVGIDRDVGEIPAGAALVGVDSPAPVAAGVVVVSKEIVLDDGRIGAAVVGQENARDVVLDDVVEDMRAGHVGGNDDAGA